MGQRSCENCKFANCCKGEFLLSEAITKFSEDLRLNEIEEVLKAWASICRRHEFAADEEEMVWS